MANTDEAFNQLHTAIYSPFSLISVSTKYHSKLWLITTILLHFWSPLIQITSMFIFII